MALEIKIPSPGESISEVELASWFVEDGALVTKNQEIGEIESEKATLPLIAVESGQLKILVQEGETVEVGVVVASIDTSVEVSDVVVDTPAVTPSAGKEADQSPEKKKAPVQATPLAKQMMEKEGLSVEDILNGLRKISAADVRQVIRSNSTAKLPERAHTMSREEERRKVSQLRKKISERLVAVKNETAMLTTFNEADMSAIMSIRKKYQEQFR